MQRFRLVRSPRTLDWREAASTLGHSVWLDAGVYADGCECGERIGSSLRRHRDRAVALHLKARLGPAGFRLATGLLTAGFAGTLDDLLAVAAAVDG